ncbi:radical SAM protein [Clostridium sp.]|uniref:radical SAM/SPASM domain-containing protein n=1 Tax=Clostridium sp. TaxID=1506 RepID=UPI003216C4A9
MKASKYNTLVSMENDNKLLYNTLSRKYISYNNDNENLIMNLINNINKDEFKLEEVNFVKEMVYKGIIVKDDIDELDKIKFNEGKAKFQDQCFFLAIQPTLDCNFRCVYCWEEHKNIHMDDITAEKIIKFVENISKNVRNIEIGWFGGEPLLEFDRILMLTEKFKEICKRNGCSYRSSMVSNGYLFTDEIIDKIPELCLSRIQITLDGIAKYHNKKRPLKNGDGSYEKIKENVLKLSYKDIYMNLRINVDEENYDHITELFDIIPENNRYKVSVYLCNVFQSEKRMSLFNIYRNAISKGYKYFDTKNTYFTCEVCTKNGFTIEPTGRIVPCSMVAENGGYYGHLDDKGHPIIENQSFYLKIKNISAFDNEMCKKCIQLPMCMGGCKYSRYKNCNICNGKGPDELSLEEKIRLHYYSDNY